MLHWLGMVKVASESRHHPLHSTRRSVTLPLGTNRLLAVFEGLEGGFAIGASIIIALGLAGLDRRTLILTAIVTLLVSGFNTASVKYSSEHYLDELDGREKRSALKHYFVPACIEFVCYVGISVFSILPLLMIVDITYALLTTAVFTLALLFAAGFLRGHMLRRHRLRDASETMLLGLGIIAVGVIAGWLMQLVP
jgi:hypothetical protein